MMHVLQRITQFYLPLDITTHAISGFYSAFQRAIDQVRTFSLSPPIGGSKSKFVILVDKHQFKANKLYYKDFCVKTSSSEVVAEPFPLSNGVYMLAVNVT